MPGIMSLASSRLRNAPTGIFGLLRTKSRSAPKNQDVLDFILDLRVLLQLVEKLPETSFRRAEILNVLTQVHQVLYYDPTATDAETWHTSLATAHRVMAPPWLKKTVAAPPADLVGHSHIDTAWLWPMDETIKKDCPHRSQPVQPAGPVPSMVHPERCLPHLADGTALPAGHSASCKSG